MISLFDLPQSIWRDKILLCCNKLKDLLRVDTAVNNKVDRENFLTNMSGCKGFDDFSYESEAGKIRWFVLRKITVRNVSLHTELAAEDRPYVQQLFANAISVLFEDGSLQHANDLAPCVGATALTTLLFGFATIEDCSGLSVCTGLTNLRLTDCPNITDEFFSRGVASCAQLEECCLFNCAKLRAGAVVALLNNCVHLTNLSLAGGFDLEEVFTQVTSELTLTDLSCSDQPNLPSAFSGAAIRAMAQVTPQLHTLHLLFTANSVQDSDIEVLVRSCRGLVDVSFYSFTSITSTALVSMAHYLPDLYSVSLDECTGVTDEGVIALAKSATKLETLSLMNVNITDVAVQAIGTHCRELQSLGVSGCSSLTDNAFTTLNVTHLQILNVSGTRVTGTFAAHILSSQAVLDSLLMFPAGLLNADLVHSLLRNTKLTTLVMGLNQLAEPDWLELSTKFPNLHSLTIIAAAAVTDAVALSFRAHCPKLFSPTLHGCRVSAEVLELLRQRP